MATSHLNRSYYFTTEDEMDRLFSESGVDYRIDDLDASGKTNTILELRARATEDVLAYIGALYDEDVLADSTWVRDRATVIACYKLSIRLGNDVQYYNEYLDALADLESVRDGLLHLPNTPQSFGTLAEFGNVSTDLRYPFQPIRTDSFSSSIDLGDIENPKTLFPYLWF